MLAATIFTPSINGDDMLARLAGVRTPPGAPLIGLSPVPSDPGPALPAGQEQHRSTSHHQERKTAVNIIQGMHLSRIRIVLTAVALAIARLLVSPRQLRPSPAPPPPSPSAPRPPTPPA